MSLKPTVCNFFVSSDPTWSERTYPDTLEKPLYFQRVRWEGWQNIFLPATEQFPLMCLRSDGFTGLPHPDCELVLVRRVKNRRGRGYRLFELPPEKISQSIFEAMLEQGRARAHRKMLPSYDLERNIYHKTVEGSVLTVCCDVVRGLGKKYDGSYVSGSMTSHTDPTGKIKRNLVALVGAAHLREEPRSYLEILKEREPRFAWTVN